MSRIWSALFSPRISDPDPARQWKLNSFHAFLSIFIAFVAVPLSFVYVVFGLIPLLCLGLGGAACLVPAFPLLRRGRLGAAVNLVNGVMVLETVLITAFLGTNDAAYFFFFYVLLANLFLDIKASLPWALVVSAAMLAIARWVPAMTVFPPVEQLPGGGSRIVMTGTHLSSPLLLTWAVFAGSAFVPNMFASLLGRLRQDNVRLNREIEEHKRTQQERLRLESELHQDEKLRAIGQLAGGVAHDFNNQLAGIMGCADILRRELAGDPARSELADLIIKSSRRAAALTNQLLAFARKGKYQVTRCNIHTLIGESVLMLRRSVDKKISIGQRLNAEDPFVRGDPSQLQNALLNLGLNARDAMPQGGELTFETDSVSVGGERGRTEPELPDGDYVRIRVRDTGHGMDSATLRRVFEPFFTTKETGTGMGLASAYGTIRNHEGAIRIDSSPGAGTAVTVLLPVDAEPVDEGGDPVATQRPRQATGRVLVVDDEVSVCRTVARLLERCGFTATTCHSSREGLALYQRRWREIDLAVVDLVMPGFSGKELFHKLREINPEIGILVSSGHSLDGDAQGLVDSGNAGFVQKPYTQAELMTAINKLLPG